VTAYSIAATAIVLLGASALGVQLGLPTFVLGVLTAGVVLALSRQSPWPVLKGVS
jgi:arsenical pump membrane protein